jgi:hypothetical protein
MTGAFHDDIDGLVILSAKNSTINNDVMALIELGSPL